MVGSVPVGGDAPVTVQTMTNTITADAKATIDQIRCAFPQGATGEGAVINHFSALPAFEHEQMTKAMASTDNVLFPVWQWD
jgi:4-hydroxy-3-methylbut-2-en-1-yl diphosphate synthase IspG/GcpE